MMQIVSTVGDNILISKMRKKAAVLDENRGSRMNVGNPDLAHYFIKELFYEEE